MRQKQAVIFDWDGTLANTVPEIYKGVCAVCAHCSVEHPTLENYRLHFRLPFVDYYRERGVGLSSDEILQVFNNSVDLRQCQLFPDVLDILQELKRREIRTALVTSQAEEIVLHHCEQNRIRVFFEDIVAGQASKTTAIKKFCAVHKLDPSHVWYVGDTISDITDAAAAGVKPIGIMHSYGARYCIENLRQLLHLF